MFLFHSIQYHILIVLPISRHEARQIYTYIGDVCVSVNPYTELSIYDQATVNQYKGGDNNAHGGFFQDHFYQDERFLSEPLTCLQSRTLLTSRCGGTGRTPASSSQVGNKQVDRDVGSLHRLKVLNKKREVSGRANIF